MHIAENRDKLEAICNVNFQAILAVSSPFFLVLGIKSSVQSLSVLGKCLTTELDSTSHKHFLS